MKSCRIEELRRFGVAAFVAAGMREADAACVVANLLWSDLRGIDTHGFERLPWYIGWLTSGRVDPKAELEILVETPSVLVGDGHGGLGQLVVTRFSERLIEAAKASGLVVGTLRNSNDWGCGANYPWHAAQAGFVCFATTTSVPTLAPFGSRRRLLGNNPIVWAFPRGAGPPIVLDMALTPVALGKVMRARAEAAPIPLAWGFRDRDGTPTADAASALAGIIPAIGGYKGIGLAVVSNLLAGVLSGSAQGADVEVGRRGQFFLLFDPGLFGPREQYQAGVDAMVAAIHAAQEEALPGERVWLPGEIEQLALETRSQARTLPYPDSLVRALEETAQKLGVRFDAGPS